MELVTGWIEGLGPEQHWRVMVAALTLLFIIGVLVGAMDARSDGDKARAGHGVPQVEAQL